MFKLSIFAAVLGALSTVVLAGPPTCPANSPLSCSLQTTPSDTCCYEVQGQILQVQFWDTDPATGPADHWTIHGLWPDFCNGSYTGFCDESRQYTNITCILEEYEAYDLLDTMKMYWKDQGGNDESFWEHEWGKHGTCYSTLQPSCYTDYEPQEEVVNFFNQTVNLFQTIPTYEWLAAANITPTAEHNYTYDEIMAALNKQRGVNATLECDNGQLYEIEYTFNVQGSVADGKFVPAEPVGEGTNGCPDSIQYLPKNLGSTPTPISNLTCSGVSPGPSSTTGGYGASSTAYGSSSSSGYGSYPTDGGYGYLAW